MTAINANRVVMRLSFATGATRRRASPRIMESVMSYLHTELPPITLSTTDAERLLRLADVARRRFPNAAAVLSREVDRADIVSPWQILPGVVAMGAEVDFSDDSTCEVRCVTLVYPHEADITAGKISILTPIGAALIGLSVSQSIE